MAYRKPKTPVATFKEVASVQCRVCGWGFILAFIDLHPRYWQVDASMKRGRSDDGINMPSLMVGPVTVALYHLPGGEVHGTTH